MKEYALYVFDLDGVLYRGNEVVPGTQDAVSRLVAKGAAVRYLTNNSSKTRDDYASKLRGMGFPAEQSQVYSSGSAAAAYLSECGARSVSVLGEQGLVAEIEARGIGIAGPGPADWVVVGICWGLTYDGIDDAQRRVRQGARFLATNPDLTFPDEGGVLRAGAGSIVAAVAAAAGREPDVMIGKPEPTLLQMIWADTGFHPDQTLLVGDQPDTDVLCAHRAGCDSALVLTGVVASLDPKSPQPTFVLESAAEVR